MTTARVAITGYMHEVNAFAPVSTRADGRRVGDDPDGPWHEWHAIRRLRELRSVEIVDLPIWEFGASGPLDDDAFTTVVDEITAGLRAAAPLDGVLVFGHGAGRTVTDLDADSTFLRAVRSAVGDATPVSVVLDFHANVSPAMCDLADVIVGYRHNPHIDIREREVEAAEHLHRLLDGRPTVRALCSVPMVLAQLAQNTTPGEPLGEVRAAADALVGDGVLNVSVFGGFSLADVPDGGLSVVVTAEVAAADRASMIAADLAAHAWSLRPRYRTATTPLADAVRIAAEASADRAPPVLLADTSDNPGGGAPGNATFVLAALLDAGVDGVVSGLHCDPGVVDAAWTVGEGAELDVTFNSGSVDPLATPLTVRATVVRLVDAPLVPTKGVYRDLPRHPGRCCALRIAGVDVAVSSHKVQCADDDTLAHVGLDTSRARVIVVKSRGHFRAGFAHLVPDERIVEVGAPGLAPATLDGVVFTNVTRPVWPLDDVDAWTPTVTVHGAKVST